MKQKKNIIYIIISLTAIYVCITVIKNLYHKNIKDNTFTYSDSQKENSNSESPVLYNTKPIADAYLSGDSSTLSEFDKSIYDKAIEIISNVITDDMSDYEKELAIHDYITLHTTYDMDSLGILDEHSKNSENPYGALINRKAICTGYTSTFKMFMDMFEIPNIAVFAKDASDNNHAWNMIQLDDEWYYVDATWDDPVPDEENRLALHKYFNVTEDFLKNNEHVWDSSNLPKANSTKYSYEKMTGKSEEELKYEIQTLY